MDLLKLLDILLAGVPSNAAWDLIKTVWRKASQRSWEDLYVDAFESAVAEMRPFLRVYAKEKEVSLNREDLSRVLHRVLAVDIEASPLSMLSSDEFTSKVAEAMAAGSVLAIGGHTLSDDDYKQLVSNLVGHAKARFRTAILESEPALHHAILEEALTNQALVQQVNELLVDKFSIVLPELDTVKQTVGRLEQKLEGFISAWQRQVGLSLQRNFIDYEDYVTDKTQGFVGRRFLFDALDQFLHANSSGYFIIRGDPGIGKTAFLAQLVKLRRYPHHFNIAAEGISSSSRFFLNAAAQIIACYGLGYPELPIEAERDNNFLKQVLAEAAKKLPGRKVILAVDALDETAQPGSAVRDNPLSLPKSLPTGVYIVVTTRRTDRGLELDVENYRVLELEADSEGNLRDVWAFIEAFAEKPVMSARLKEWGVDRPTFVEALQRKSEGNFMYLHHVLPAIEAGRFNTGRIDELPQGLLKYYEQHWEKMRGEDRDTFVRINQKVIAQLATARQPVSLFFISRVTGLQLAEVQWTVEKWREFLHELPSVRGSQFRLYHDSYRDFLEKQVVG